MRKRARLFTPRWCLALGIGLLLSAAVCSGPAVAGVVSSDPRLQQDERFWKFRVYLDDREIGFHEFRVDGDNRQARVEVDASFDVKFLFITAYTYRHSTVETWRDGCLTRIESKTDANGTRTEVSGSLGASGFELDGSGGDRIVEDGCLQTFAYWNPSILEADKLLNAQTGELEHVEILERGVETLQVGEAAIAARRYSIDMETGAIDLWYHRDNGQWLALEAPTEGGRILRYEPVGLPRDLQPDERLAME